MAATTQKKSSTRSGKAKRAQAAKKAAATRRARAHEREAAKARALAKRRATLRDKARKHKARSDAAKRGARLRQKKQRARAALDSFLSAVDGKVREHELTKVKESWRKAKRELEVEVDDVDRYLEMLEDMASEADTSWDIGYGSTTEAA